MFLQYLLPHFCGKNVFSAIFTLVKLFPGRQISTENDLPRLISPHTPRNFLPDLPRNLPLLPILLHPLEAKRRPSPNPNVPLRQHKNHSEGTAIHRILHGNCPQRAQEANEGLRRVLHVPQTSFRATIARCHQEHHAEGLRPLRRSRIVLQRGERPAERPHGCVERREVEENAGENLPELHLGQDEVDLSDFARLQQGPGGDYRGACGERRGD